MSSTNRSNKRDGHKDDYYVTPPWCVREWCRAWDNQTHELQRLQLKENAIILDPCAGGDNVNPMTYPMVLQEWGINALSMDIRPDSPAQFPGTDFLAADFGDLRVDMVVTNPPYNLAIEVIEKAMQVVKPMGWIIMLLRINFLGSQKRGPWFAEHMPHSIYTHSRRPSFYPDNWRELMPHLEKKGTDSTEYGHFVWQNASKSTYPYQGFVIPHVRGVSDAPGPFYAEAA